MDNVIRNHFFKHGTQQKQGMGLYVHIPFCLSRCNYCDFVSTAGLPRKWQSRYADCLLAELDMYLGAIGRTGAGFTHDLEGAWPTPVWETVYIGGGTPTYLDDDLLGRIAAGAAGAAGKCREFTVEANPGTLTQSKLAALWEAGCNRLSIGAQSFDDKYLDWLGRRHRARDFALAWEMARAAGFENMSLDLLYGLPGQSIKHWRDTLMEATSFQPEHISLYQLNIEQGTVLASREFGGETCVADEETCRQQYTLAHEVLVDKGYLHYEISNYARPGLESSHNSHYWRNGFYLGLGAGAAGYLQGLRYVNQADLETYIKQVENGVFPIAEREEIDDKTAISEDLMLAFRLREGIDIKQFRQRRGLELCEVYGQALEKHVKSGLLEENGSRMQPTLEGWLNYNVWIQAYL